MFPPARGPKVHTGRPGHRGWLKVRREGAPTTTRQAEVLNTAIIGSPGDERGVVIGTDRLSAAMLAHDQFTAYEAGTITSPNVCCLGMVGAGKSSLIKTVYVERPLLLRRRRAVVVDKKLRGGEGEYAELTRRFGAEPFRFDPDDPQAVDVHERAGPGDPGRRRPRRAAATAVRGRASSPATAPWTSGTTPPSTRRTGPPCAEFEDARRVPVIPDLIATIPAVVNAPEFAGLRPATLDLIEQAAWSLRFRLRTAAGRRPGRHVRPGNLASTWCCTRS